MKIKKLLSVLLAGAMTLGLVACGGTDNGSTASTTGSTSGESAEVSTEDGATATGLDDKLVIWTLAQDLEQFAERYKEQTGVETEVVVIEPANYPTKVQTALVGGEKEPDIIVGEPQMLGDMYDAGFFANLDELTGFDRRMLPQNIH